MSELTKSYNKRITNFLYDMIEKPVKVNEYKGPLWLNTNRQIYNTEKNNEILSEGGSIQNFIFKTFKTDKERLQELDEEKKKIKEYEEAHNKYLEANSKIDQFNTNNKTGKNKSMNSTMMDLTISPSTSNTRILNKNLQKPHNYLQPVMRYKHRTNLERIYDEVNKYSYGRINKEALEEHFKKWGGNKVIKSPEEDEHVAFSYKENRFRDDYDDRGSVIGRDSQIMKGLDNFIKNDILNKETFNSEKSGINLKSKSVVRTVDNSIARKFMKDLHVKTHFKAASVFTMNLDNLNSTKNKKLNESRIDQISRNKNSNEFEKIVENETFQSVSKLNNLNELIANSKYNHLNQSTSTKIGAKLGSLDKRTFSSEHIKSSENDKIGTYSKSPNQSFLSHRRQGSENCIDPHAYSLNFNPLFSSHKETQNVDNNVLEYLKNISNPPILKVKDYDSSNRVGYSYFLTNLKNKHKEVVDSVLKANPVNFFEKFKTGIKTIVNDRDDPLKKDDDRIKIGNETYLRSQVDLISKNVLKKCNYLKDKNPNSNGKLKAGSGKLMITNGMSINDFTQKFHVPK